jgi:hypothetical protein
MSRISYLQDLLSSLFERSEGLPPKPDARDLLALCKSLLSDTGEVSGLQTAGSLLENYAHADDEQKLAFFKSLASDFDIDTAELNRQTEAYAKNRDAATLTRLLDVAEPRRQELLRRLNAVPGGTEKLVRMREDLLKVLREDKTLARIDVDFEHLFVSWFNRGFLVLRPIDWTTPAHILEKIIKYEAVHAIDSWDDLRRRLQPPDRRCFAFFHPAMPDEPLIFVEVALSRGIPGIDPDRAGRGPRRANARNGGHGGVLFHFQLPERPARGILRQLPDQAGCPGPCPEPAEHQDLRHPVASAWLHGVAQADRRRRRQRADRAALPGSKHDDPAEL